MTEDAGQILPLEAGFEGRTHPELFQPYPNREEIIEEICTRLETGEALAAMCREAHLPTRQAIGQWADRDEHLALRFARARALGEDAIAQEALEIADGKRPIEGQAPDPSRDKLRVHTRMQLLAKFNPKRWGDNVQLRHADADGKKLDTAPLVNELMTLLPGGAPLAPGATLIEQAPSVRNVTPQSPNAVEQRAQAPRKSYRPRGASGVDDLV